LLRLTDRPGSNAWFTAKTTAGDLQGYLADVLLAWRLAEQETRRQLEAGRVATAVTQVYRYALISAAVNSSADNIHPDLLSVLVANGAWPVAQALTYARRVPEPGPRIEALAAIIPYIQPGEYRLADEATATIRDVHHPLHRVRAVAALLAVLDDQRRADLTTEVIDFIAEINDEQWRATALVALAPSLAPWAASQALQLCTGIETKAARTSVLSALVARIPDPLVEATLASMQPTRAVRQFVGRPVPESIRLAVMPAMVWCGLDGWRVRALSDCGISLEQPLLDHALSVAWQITEDYLKVPI